MPSKKKSSTSGKKSKRASAADDDRSLDAAARENRRHARARARDGAVGFVRNVVLSGLLAYAKRRADSKRSPGRGEGSRRGRNLWTGVAAVPSSRGRVAAPPRGATWIFEGASTDQGRRDEDGTTPQAAHHAVRAYQRRNRALVRTTRDDAEVVLTRRDVFGPAVAASIQSCAANASVVGRFSLQGEAAAKQHPQLACLWPVFREVRDPDANAWVLRATTCAAPTAWDWSVAEPPARPGQAFAADSATASAAPRGDLSWRLRYASPGIAAAPRGRVLVLPRGDRADDGL